MPEINNPFDDDRDESPGEDAQKLASHVRTLVKAAGVTLTESENAAVAKVIGALLRAHPWIRGWIKKYAPGVID